MVSLVRVVWYVRAQEGNYQVRVVRNICASADASEDREVNHRVRDTRNENGEAHTRQLPLDSDHSPVHFTVGGY